MVKLKKKGCDFVPTLDLSFTVTAIIAVCALLSPIATAIINNQHQIRMKRLEYEHTERMAQEAHEQEIYEGYVRAAGACIQVQTNRAYEDFGSYSSLAMYYVPDEIRTDMLLLEKSMWTDNRDSKVDLLAEITIKLRELRQIQ